MSAPKYLIDTNVFIGLEDSTEVLPDFSSLVQLASKHGVGVFVHAAARDDISRDNNEARRRVSLSKIAKFQVLSKVRDLSREDLISKYGALPRPNDVVDATLLHSLDLGVADFLVTEDRGLHERTRRYVPPLKDRVLYVADAVSLLRSAYEPVDVPLRFVEEVDAHAIPLNDPIFESLRDGYPGFDRWWLNKCVKQLRRCWIVVDDGRLAGLVVRKDEKRGEGDALLSGDKVLKICTFKVRPERRGIKLGELLMKQILWFAQSNRYDVVYLTTFAQQSTLIDLLEYYGFKQTAIKDDGELVYEKPLSRQALGRTSDTSLFDEARINYPRFYTGPQIDAVTVPIREQFHEMLFPELANRSQLDLLESMSVSGARTAGNTIRKVYLCRASCRIGAPGALMMFYKSKSQFAPSQAITTVGVFESMTLAHSTEELRRLAGGRSVYSDRQLIEFATERRRPVKVINFLLAGHISPVIPLKELKMEGIVGTHPPQSIARLKPRHLPSILRRLSLGFEV